MNNNLIYIYNLEQAYFYIRKGLTPLSPPKENPNSKMVYFVFDKEQSSSLYGEWLTRSKEIRDAKK